MLKTSNKLKLNKIKFLTNTIHLVFIWTWPNSHPQFYQNRLPDHHLSPDNRRRVAEMGRATIPRSWPMADDGECNRQFLTIS